MINDTFQENAILCFKMRVGLGILGLHYINSICYVINKCNRFVML